VRASCEDGHKFIRRVAIRVAADPLPGFTGPPLSQSQRRALSREQSQEQSRGLMPPLQLPPRKRIAHFVMNLPDSAITFLGAFRGVFAQSSSPSVSDIDLKALYEVMPMVHCHCFTREMDREAAERDIRHVSAPSVFTSLAVRVDRLDGYASQRVEQQLGCGLSAENEVSLHLVRSVAPNKEMYCISFRLPRATAFGELPEPVLCHNK
jgi:tRNA (guanine37-N1)-methyltransferase